MQRGNCIIVTKVTVKMFLDNFNFKNLIVLICSTFTVIVFTYMHVL